MGPKLQERWDRHVGKTRVDSDRIDVRFARLLKQDLSAEQTAQVEQVRQAYLAASQALTVLEAQMTPVQVEATAEQVAEQVAQDLTETV